MKKIIILIIIIFVIAASSTLAFFIWNNNSNQDIAVDLKLNGLDAYINYNKGTDVLTGTLLPSTDYSGGLSTEIELWKSPSAEDRTIYGHIYLDITTIGTNLVNEEALKWVITSNGKVLNTGNFAGQTEGIYVTLDINIPLSTTKQLFQIYIWLDESMEINDQIEGETLSTKVRAEATEVIYPEVGAKYVSSLIYYDNEMINNDDPDGNIRYMGKDPDNYVLFNNELWRIIGIFDVKSSEDGPYEKRMKIIRNESIGNMTWDINNTNDWYNSSLQKYLNTEYYNNLNNADGNLVGDTYWNLGGSPDSSSGTVSHFYDDERGTNVYEGRATYWIGKIGLMYPSDYGYATSGGSITNRESCLIKNFSTWGDLSYKECAKNNYLFDSSSFQLTIMPRNTNYADIFYIGFTGAVGVYYASNANCLVYPALYLKSLVQITGGSGTSTNPYTLSINN